MWSFEYDTGTCNRENQWYADGDSKVSLHKDSEHPTHFDFTINEVNHLGHDAGTAGTHWYLTINKDLGNGRSRKFFGINIHVDDWLKLFTREMDRVRQGLEPTRYMAVRAKSNYWVEPHLCNPVIDSSLYPASQKANQKKMVA